MADDYNNPPPAAEPATDYNSYEGVTGAGVEQQPADGGAIYKMIGESKIPVSKHRGPLWRSRYDQGKAAMSKQTDA